MNLGPIVDMAIGLIFVWIVLSLGTIQIQEWINTALDKRARDMEAAIHEMLANPNLKAQFYDHPVIRGLTAKKRRWPSTVPLWFYMYPIVWGFPREIRKLPSYIPAVLAGIVRYYCHRGHRIVADPTGSPVKTKRAVSHSPFCL